MIKYAIFDDHQLFIDGIKEALSVDDNFTFMGSATNGNEALQIVLHTPIDIVILDVEFRKTNESGLDILRSIKEVKPEVKVLVLTGYSNQYLVEMLQKHGASGLRLKNIGIEDLKYTLLNIFQGEIIFNYFSMNEVRHNDRSTIVLQDRPSARAIEIISLLAEGYVAKEIADQLDISLSTVNDHIERAKRKVNARNSVELVAMATRSGII